MPRKVSRDISVKQDVYEKLKKYSTMLGVPMSRIASQLCISFIENEDRQKLDYRDIKF